MIRILTLLFVLCSVLICSSSRPLHADAMSEGGKRLLIIRIDFSDSTGNSLTEAHIRDVLEQSDTFYRLTSQGRSWIQSVDITPVLRMPQTRAWYLAKDPAGNYYNDWNLVEDSYVIAKAAGYDAGYDSQSYDYDATLWQDENFYGAGRIHGRGIIISSAAFTVKTFSHELGHGYGLLHSNRWVPLGSNPIGEGEHLEYGNIFDVMGTGMEPPANQFNTQYKDQLNWLTNGSQRVTASGIYRIQAHDMVGATGLRALVIPRDSRQYWVEFRQQFTFPESYNAVHVLMANSGTLANRLLDFNPQTPDSAMDAPLAFGRTFSDVDGQIYITPLSKAGTTPESVDVRVSVGPQPGNAAPTLSLAVSNATPNTSSPVTLTATANDSNGDTLAYYWDFGDRQDGVSTVSTNQAVQTHAWPTAGVKVVRCTVSDMRGGEITKTVLVSVQNVSRRGMTGRVLAGSLGVKNAVIVAQSGSSAYRTTTDSEGRYYFTSLLPGSYTLDARATDYTVTPAFTSPVVIATGNTFLENIDFNAVGVGTGDTSVVTTTNDSGPGSLRAAITLALRRTNHQIRFAIPTSDSGHSNGVWRIKVTKSFEDLLSNGTVIDATTQPGYQGQPVIEVSCESMPVSPGYKTGLFNFAGADCALNGISIIGCKGTAVYVAGKSALNFKMTGCWLGQAANGAIVGNVNALGIADGATNVDIGGDAAGAGNIIIGSQENGVSISNAGPNVRLTNNVIRNNQRDGIVAETSTGTIIQGNLIGNDANGEAQPNGWRGVRLSDCKNTLIGGPAVARGNIISGNASHGVLISGASTQTTLQNNIIGTNRAGTAALPNGGSGVYINEKSRGAIIGNAPQDTTPAGNLISGNRNEGIWIGQAGTGDILVRGNRIGTNAAGNAALANSGHGIVVCQGTTDTTIGGAGISDRNLISGNVADGVWVVNEGTGNTRIENNYIGTDISGLTAIPNQYAGVAITSGAKNNIVRNNLLSGNKSQGVYIGDSGTNNNVIEGNRIGVDASGSGLLGNTSDGIVINAGASGNLIGGNSAAARNVISGNSSGISILTSSAEDNIVQGNYIGTNAQGTAAIANRAFGVYVGSGARRTVVQQNVVSGNTYAGVFITGAGTMNTRVQGNLVGTNAAGTEALANKWSGVEVHDGALYTLVGGLNASERNVLSGNTLRGLHIGDTGTKFNEAQGNYIGVDINGTTALANAVEGIVLNNGATENTIGGTADGAGNIVSGNGGSGFWIGNNGTNSNMIAGNSIGTDSTGKLDLGNGGDGLVVTVGAQNTNIGGALGNRIAYNKGYGISVWDAATTGTTMRCNAIYQNQKLGINLVGNEGAYGVTANDANDVDTNAPNNLQNFPVLTSVNSAGGMTRISGSLNAQPNRAYYLDFYHSAMADPSGYGEGEVYLPMATRTTGTDASGNLNFEIDIMGSFGNRYFTAIATDMSTGDSSEFSAARQATGVKYITVSIANAAPVAEGSNTAPGSSTFVVTLSEASTQTITVNYTTANGTVKPALAGSDYIVQSGSVTFAPNSGLTRTISIPFIGDSQVEEDETFFVVLNNPVNANLDVSQALGTILNDDFDVTAPSITVSSPAAGSIIK